MAGYIHTRHSTTQTNIKMPDYSQGKVYAIRSHKTTQVYVGSTCQSLAERMSGHRRDYKCYLNGREHYRSSYEILKHGDAYIELIERVNATDKMDLLVRENHYVREMDCVNKHNPGALLLAGGIKEYKKQYNPVYYQNNKDAIKVQNAEYRQNNRDVILAQKNKKNECDCGTVYTQSNKSRHKKSRLHRLYILNLHHELNHLANL